MTRTIHNNGAASTELYRFARGFVVVALPVTRRPWFRFVKKNQKISGSQRKGCS